MAARSLEIRGNLQSDYPDVYTNEALAALEALAPLDTDRKAVMRARIERRNARSRNKQRITFLDPQRDDRANKDQSSGCTRRQLCRQRDSQDLQRQWIQGTGPAASRIRRWKRASATSLMHCCPAPTAGCSTAKMPWARSRRCPWTTTATSSSPSIAIRFS